jgi:tetratricopeptide (TPR) repeat protein
LAPENAALHYRMGVVHKNLREYSEAAGELRKAVQYEPQNLAAHTLLSGVMALSLVYGIVPQTAEAR